MAGCALASSLVVFDEDDPLGQGYQDASVAGATAPSTLKLAGPGSDKLPVDTAHAQHGHSALRLAWTSQPGGHWFALVAPEGFTPLACGPQTTLSLWLRAEEPVSASALPILELETEPPSLSRPVSLGQLLPAGLEGGSAPWQEVRLPLAALGLTNDLIRVTGVKLRQNASDAAPHLLWCDRIRLLDPASPDVPPSPPTQVHALGADGLVTLRWDPAPPGTVEGYLVFRAVDAQHPADFTRITPEPLADHFFTDAHVTNGLRYRYQVAAVADARSSVPSTPAEATPKAIATDREFLELLERSAFDYFWYESHPRTGLVRDRSRTYSPASIAATGFGLTALGIGADHGWITRAQAAEQALLTLQTLATAPRGDQALGTIGCRGWFYHFLHAETATRSGRSELSSIDTALLMAGVLYAREYFDAGNRVETSLRGLANRLLEDIDWPWMLNGGETLSMGWHPESGFIASRWTGYNEAMILYLLGLGAQAQPLSADCWTAWCQGYRWQTHYGMGFLGFAPLFGHQYSHCWIDFRSQADVWLRPHGIDYFENSRRATRAQMAYAVENPQHHVGYGDSGWGWTACDGPGAPGTHAYIARGAPPGEFDDGTLAPTAPGGSLAFTPGESLRLLRQLYDTHRERVWTAYGFRDAYHPGLRWWGPDVIGIDQGPILLMAENLRAGGVWRVFMRAPEIRRGLERAGFEPLPTASR